MFQPQLAKLQTLNSFKHMILQFMSDLRSSGVIEKEQYEQSAVFRATQNTRSKLFEVMQQIKLTGKLPADFQESYEGNVKEADLFFEAVNDNQILTVKEMVTKNKMLLSERNERLETPLHVAIRMEKVKLIKFLLEAGADIHTKDL